MALTRVTWRTSLEHPVLRHSQEAMQWNAVYLECYVEIRATGQRETNRHALLGTQERGISQRLQEVGNLFKVACLDCEIFCAFCDLYCNRFVLPIEQKTFFFNLHFLLNQVNTQKALLFHLSCRASWRLPILLSLWDRKWQIT